MHHPLDHEFMHLGALPTTAVTTFGHNIEDQLASLFTSVPGADNFNGLILGLVTGDLDLGTRLLAKLVDGRATRSDNEPAIC